MYLSVFDISPKVVSLLSAPQRPIATQRTTAAPKAGPGMVRKNPGVGNGDDEAAKLMQQVCASVFTLSLSVPRVPHIGEARLLCLPGQM